MHLGSRDIGHLVTGCKVGSLSGEASRQNSHKGLKTIDPRITFSRLHFRDTLIMTSSLVTHMVLTNSKVPKMVGFRHNNNLVNQ